MAKAVYLDIARKYNVPYGGILWWGVLMERGLRVNALKTPPNDERERLAILSVLECGLTGDQIMDMEIEIFKAVEERLMEEKNALQGTG